MGKPKPDIKEVAAKAKQLVMNLYMLCNAFLMKLPLEDLKSMHPEDAYFVELEVQQQIEKVRLNPILKNSR